MMRDASDFINLHTAKHFPKYLFVERLMRTLSLIAAELLSGSNLLGFLEQDWPARGFL
jgi:hypothetical protein